MEKAGQPIKGLLFLESGLVVLALPRNGISPKVGVIGNEGACGTQALLNSMHSVCEATVLACGRGYVASVERSRCNFSGASFFAESCWPAGEQFLEAARSASEIAHELAPRLAAFLLLCADRSQQNRLWLTQAQVAQLLSVRRTSISLVVGHFKNKGWVKQQRNIIAIVDRACLETAAGECYAGPSVRPPDPPRAKQQIAEFSPREAVSRGSRPCMRGAAAMMP